MSRLCCCSLLLCLLAHTAWAQFPVADKLTGQVRDHRTHQPVSYASVGVVHYPYGTVADEQGRFLLALPAQYDADSLRFSAVGYAPRTLTVAQVRRVAGQGPIDLLPQAVPLAEALVRSTGLQPHQVGFLRGLVIAGFDYNRAGNQLGQYVALSKPGRLETVAFQLRTCTYDSVYLRLNVYRVKAKYPAENLVTQPILLRLSRQQALAGVQLDLRDQHIWLPSDVIIALELVRDLGEGSLCFSGQFLRGPAYMLEQTPGPLSVRNTPPAHTHAISGGEQLQGAGGPWKRYTTVGIGLQTTIGQLPGKTL